MAKLEENRYGKSRVRLARVKRHATHNNFHEWNVEILLQGDFASCFEAGDNRRILPTDTMKNTVYSVARNSAAQTIEGFAMELSAFLISRNPQITAAEVTVTEKPWDHLPLHGQPHPTTFIQNSTERHTTTVLQKQSGHSPPSDGQKSQRKRKLTIVSGLQNLVIMKTADSAFSGYIKDSLTTLPESQDRLFGTAVWSRWTYSPAAFDFAALRRQIREELLDVFATHKSASVQHTLYAMAERVLQKVSAVEDITLRMPNLHCLPVDLARFGQDNPNEIFVPIDEPHGYIEARISRAGTSGKG
jgi:urate oxidase